MTPTCDSFQSPEPPSLWLAFALPSQATQRDFTTSFGNSFQGQQLPPKKDKIIKMVQVRNYYRDVTTVRLAAFVASSSLYAHSSATCSLRAHAPTCAVWACERST